MFVDCVLFCVFVLFVVFVLLQAWNVCMCCSYDFCLLFILFVVDWRAGMFACYVCTLRIFVLRVLMMGSSNVDFELLYELSWHRG